MVIEDNAMTTEGLHGDVNGFVGNESANGRNVEHGWQKVTYAKKQKRQENKGKIRTGEDGEKLNSTSSDLKLFRALDHKAEDRRVRLEARAAAALAAGDFNSVEEASDAEDDVHAQTDGDAENALKKPKVKKPKKPRVSIAEAAAAIDPSDLAIFLSDVSESFASDPDLQLLRCADYFGRAFSAVTTVQFGWNKLLRETPLAKTNEIPLCFVPEIVINMLADWLSLRPAEALSKFVLWILKEVLDDVHAHTASHKNSKISAPPSQKTKVGILILLATILRRVPEILLHQASTVRNQFQGPDQLPTLVWVYGQAAQGDLVVGMHMWVQNLLPLAVAKSSTPAVRDTALQFIESVLFANFKKARPILLDGCSRKGERLVPACSLDLMLRAAYPSESARTKAAERFQAVYPIIKELALAGSRNSKTTRSVAHQLLPLSVAALSQDVDGLSEQACSNFMWCLYQNADCYQQWELLHLENLKASNIVLGHIRHEWKDVSHLLSPPTKLKKTIQVFRSKHKKALETTQRNEAQVKIADGHCKAILSKLSAFPSCVGATLTLVAGAGMAYGFYLISPDVNPWKWDGWILLSKTHSLF